MDTEQDKLRKLREYLEGLGSVAIAFSGGVDSAFLLRVAKDVLGEKAVAVTARSHVFPEREWKESAEFCDREGIRQIFCDREELQIPGFRENPPDRCYLCKKDLMGKIRLLAEEQGIPHVAEGSNVDDEGDYRPGQRAVKELGIHSPLRAAGLHKEEIRSLSAGLGLPTWNKPSFACLASRFAYGERISEEKLSMVERAEQFLADQGFRQFRVRIHGEKPGTIARIEVETEEFGRLAEQRESVASVLEEIGFMYITMDLRGYRMGSMNKVLEGQKGQGNG